MLQHSEPLVLLIAHLGNQISAKGAKAVAEALKGCSQMRSLSLARMFVIVDFQRSLLSAQCPLFARFSSLCSVPHFILIFFHVNFAPCLFRRSDRERLLEQRAQ